ncbi:MAG: hypothetical protein KDC05_11715 [Bacteroidales bacterium]|nr:hypothetical protein [Bacteroidales bacterium]
MNTMTEKESLRIIHEMIATSKGNLKDNSFFYLLWGWLVLIASLSHFILEQFKYDQPYLVWPLLMGTGAVVSVIAGIRIGKKAKVVTLVDRSIMYLWWSFLVVIMIVLLMASLQKISWVGSNVLIMSMYGLGTFVSGGLLKFKPLMIGGIAAWILALVALFVDPSWVMLLIAASIIIAYLVPGYMLKSKEVK